ALESNTELTSKDMVKRGKTHKRKKAKKKAIETAPKTERGTDWEIIRGDCRLVLPKLSGARLIFADPPYNIGVDYGGDYDDSKTPGQFFSWCLNWINDCAEALADDGSFWLLATPSLCAELWPQCKQAGLRLRQWITWYESFGVNTSKMFNKCSRSIL